MRLQRPSSRPRAHTHFHPSCLVVHVSDHVRSQSPSAPTTTGPPVDFARWIKKRLKEAKGAGLIRVAKASGTAPALATATVQYNSARPTDEPSDSKEPVPTSFATPPASPAPAPASPVAAGGANTKQPREYALPPTPEPAAVAVQSTPKRADASNKSIDAPVSPEFSPSVFKPASAVKAWHSMESMPEIDTSMEAEPTAAAEVPAEVEPAPQPAPKQPRPEYDDIDVDDDVDANSAWFKKKESEAPVDDGIRGVTWNVPPGSLPPASIPTVIDAIKGKDEIMAGTIGSVGDKARRMAEATALARRDLAARAGNAGAVGGTDTDTSVRDTTGKRSGLSVAARSHAKLLAVQAERRGVSQKDREVECLRRREQALAEKNRELTKALSATTQRASKRESSLREAKANAQVADKQLRAALERAKLGYAPRLQTAARGGARAFRSKNDGYVFADVHQKGTSTKYPSTLREAATQFIGGDEGSSLKRDRVSSPFSPPPRAAPKKRGEGKTDGFLERMKLREEETKKRREMRAWSTRADVSKYSSRKPGWDDSPDVVVKVGDSPEENRRREKVREAERALLAARREALLLEERDLRKGETAGAVGVDQIMGNMGFVKEAERARSQSPGKSPSAKPKMFPGELPKLSPAAERQRQADARRAAGLDPKFERITYGKSPKSSSGKNTKRHTTTTPPSKRKNDQELRAEATRMLDTPEGRASLCASGFDLDGARRSVDAMRDPPSKPGAQPQTKLFAMSPARRVTQDAGGDPRKEIAVMRGILDEVVAHLRVLHMAQQGGGDGNEMDANGVGARYSGGLSQSMSIVGSDSTSSTGPYALDSMDRSKALEMLRQVEAREIAMRRKWGLGGAGTGKTSTSSYTRASLFDSDPEERARSSISEIEADMKHVTERTSVEAGSLRNAGLIAIESELDSDSVARVWEARSKFIQWRAAVDESVVVNDGEGDAFDPSEVNEEIAERLLDGLLTDVAVELTGACDDATAAVLRQEFTSSTETNRSNGNDSSADDALFGIGSYDHSSNLIDDDIVGAAVERAYRKGGGWKLGE